MGGASTDERRLCVFFFGPREMRLSAAVLALGIPWVVTVAPLITGIVLYTLGLSRLQLVAHATLCILCSFFIVLLQVGPLRLILLVRHLVLCALQVALQDRVGYMHDHSVVYRSLMFKAGVMDHDAALTCFHCDSAGAIRRTKEKDDDEGDEEGDLRYLFF